MSNKRYEEENNIYLRYFYPYKKGEQPVLINKFGITDQKKLDLVENDIVISLMPTRPKLKQFSLMEIQKIHKYLFGKIYDWAGEIRNYTTGRAVIPFARPELISTFYESAILKNLKKENFLIGTNKSEFINRASFFINEFNAIHPFIDGNGRITRIFLQDLAEISKHKLDIQSITKDSWYNAMENGFLTGETKEIEKEISKYYIEKQQYYSIEFNYNQEVSKQNGKNTYNVLVNSVPAQQAVKNDPNVVNVLKGLANHSDIKAKEITLEQLQSGFIQPKKLDNEIKVTRPDNRTLDANGHKIEAQKQKSSSLEL